MRPATERFWSHDLIECCAMLAQLNTQVSAVLSEPAVRAKFAEQSAEVRGWSSGQSTEGRWRIFHRLLAPGQRGALSTYEKLRAVNLEEPVMADLCILDVGDDVSAEAIERGCQAGEALIKARGFTVDQAYQAVLSRANNERHNSKAANAWDAAEDATFAVVYGPDRDDWPDDPVLSIEGA